MNFIWLFIYVFIYLYWFILSRSDLIVMGQLCLPRLHSLLITIPTTYVYAIASKCWYDYSGICGVRSDVVNLSKTQTSGEDIEIHCLQLLNLILEIWFIVIKVILKSCYSWFRFLLSAPRWQYMMAQVPGFLLPTLSESQVKFWIPSFNLAQSCVLQAFKKWIGGLKISLFLPLCQIKQANI